jgi:hypothetical protein
MFDVPVIRAGRGKALLELLNLWPEEEPSERWSMVVVAAHFLSASEGAVSRGISHLSRRRRLSSSRCRFHIY